MKYLFKFLFLSYFMVLLITGGEVSYASVLVFVLATALNIFMARFRDSVSLASASFVLICAGIYLDRNFSFLLCIPLFDLTTQKAYLSALPVFLTGLYLAWASGLAPLVLLLGLSLLLGFVLRHAAEKEAVYTNRLDEERGLRYELEVSKTRLLQASRDIAHLTEVRERNRIAREIHDNLGHSIVGILIQLQAAQKLLGRDDRKAGDILAKSINALSEALTLLRHTVHNLKPQETLGVEYIESIIANFCFCPVALQLHGDFGLLSANHLEMAGAITKEALTNAAKYSQATRIEIALDSNEKYLRLSIRDNGVGCAKLQEGLGISGMRERVRNLGGIISLSSQDGFLIVCILPLEQGGGVLS